MTCTLTYPEGPKQAEPKAGKSPEPSTLQAPKRSTPEAPAPQNVQPKSVSSEPALGGFVGVIIVLIVIGAVIGLWMLFGSGGVLLARAPMTTVNLTERPPNWNDDAPDVHVKSRDFLAHIAAMPDRREALVQLLRQCLLQSAKRTGTRVLRSDTERTVFARLPRKMEYRDELRHLLLQTELAHYGGQVPPESAFSDLLKHAQPLLSAGGSARV